MSRRIWGVSRGLFVQWPLPLLPTFQQKILHQCEASGEGTLLLRLTAAGDAHLDADLLHATIVESRIGQQNGLGVTSALKEG